MTVLVLGGCGFIGSHIVDRLLAEGHAVRVFDRHPERFRPPLSGVDVRLGSFADPAAVTGALSGVSAVIHLVSTTFPGTADLAPASDVQDNLIGTLMLLDAMVDLGVGRILFLSSGGTVYGVPQQLPIPETHPLSPVGSYGIVKVAIESYLGLYARTKSLSPVIIRAANPYGPRQGHSGVQGIVTTFLRCLVEGRPVEIWGDGTVVRDYLPVNDLAALCVAAIASDHTGIYNAGSGVGTSVNDLVAVLRLVTGREIRPVYRPARPVDVPRSILDVTRARRDFGWQARTDLRDGVAETWDWLRSHPPDSAS